MARQRPAKPRHPGSNPGAASSLKIVAGVAEVGRRKGLKIPRRIFGVPVQIRPPAQRVSGAMKQVSCNQIQDRAVSSDG